MTRTIHSRGSAISLVLIVIATISVCAAAALSYTGLISRHVHRSNQQRRAIEIGDGVLEYAFATWREQCRPTPNRHLSTDELAHLPLPTGSFFPHVQNFSATRASDRTKLVSNYDIRALDCTWKPVAGSVSPPPTYGMNWNTSTYAYLASADVTMPSISGTPLQVNVRRILLKELQSPWNYAIFYVDPLEIHPGPQFNVTGWVHTNAKLYTGHNTLSFLSKVSYGEDWSVGFMPGDGAHNGETPLAPSYANGQPPALEQAQQPFGLDATRIFNDADENPNNDDYRGLIERPVPGEEDPLGEARYYNQADVKILLKDVGGTQSVTILNRDNVACTGLSTGNDRALYDVFTSALRLNDTIRDNREASTVRLTTVDVGIINTALRPGGALAGVGFRGVIYISDTSATSGSRRGVRLRNGGILPPGGLTVTSDNPVYIQGDYNTGTNGSTQPNSNASNGDPTRNTVTNYAKQPSAVIADAVMILSNNWSDARSTQSLSQRPATNTTVNTAIVAGIVPTANGNYSGGAENFPRFMENWNSTVNFTYYGSMVQLFKSEQAPGIWGQANVYSAPRRRWYFDTQLYTQPPPGTLTLVSYKKGRWYFE